MFWFAWSGQYNSVHWIVPTLAGVFLATSILFIFVAFLNYLTDTYLMFAASALAANTVCRSACGAASPLFTNYMFDSLGVGGGGSLVGGVAVLLMPIPFIFYKYGGAIRERSKFAPTKPKAVDQEVPQEQEPKEEYEEETANESGPDREKSGELTEGEGTATEVDEPRYIRAGVGLDRVAAPEDTREVDAAQQ